MREQRAPLAKHLQDGVARRCVLYLFHVRRVRSVFLHCKIGTETGARCSGETRHLLLSARPCTGCIASPAHGDRRAEAMTGYGDVGGARSNGSHDPADRTAKPRRCSWAALRVRPGGSRASRRMTGGHDGRFEGTGSASTRRGRSGTGASIAHSGCKPTTRPGSISSRARMAVRTGSRTCAWRMARATRWSARSLPVKLALSEIGQRYGSDAFFLIATALKPLANGKAYPGLCRRPKPPPAHVRAATMLELVVEERLPDGPSDARASRTRYRGLKWKRWTTRAPERDPIGLNWITLSFSLFSHFRLSGDAA